MKKVILFMIGFILCIPFSVSAEEYEAKVTINQISPSSVLGEYYYESLEEAFKDVSNKEALHNTSGKSGVVTATLQLLNDSSVNNTLVFNSNNSNMMLDFNGYSITSSADPVIQAGAMTFVSNSSATPCFIVQKNVSNVSSTTPNTIFYAPSNSLMFNINAKNLTIGDKTGTAVYSQAMLPSIQNGIFLGKMQINPPMFGATATGGYFLEDPTSLIDTNAYAAVKNSDNLYYLIKYHAALADSDGAIIKKYGFLQDAMDIAKDNEIIKLLKHDYPPKTVIINKGNNINLDLAGFDLTGSPDSAIPTLGTSLVKNFGTLTINDSSGKLQALNFVSTKDVEGDCFSTIYNQGVLNIQEAGVFVNYNQPNYKGNIYTICNDSTSSDAIIYIDAAAKVGGLQLELDDPATGKYPAIKTSGNGEYKNEIRVEYGNDEIIYSTENTIINEIMNVFDADGNFTTKLSLVDSELKEKNIVIKNNGVDVDFTYDEETDTLTIPASQFTNESDKFTISYRFEVTYVIDGRIVSFGYIEAGQDAVAPELPSKNGYTVTWDNNGKKILGNTTITAVYTSNIKSPNTSDNIIFYVVMLIISISVILGIKYKLRNN